MKDSVVQARKLKGFIDYPPKVTVVRNRIAEAMRREAHLAGFAEVDTPALEYAEVLLGVGGETDKQVFRFTDNGGRDVALRFDLTVPFARFIAEHQGELVMPFKRLQIGQVWRAEKPQKGRYREFGQCDLDIIGVKSILADAEIVVCFAHIISAIVERPFTMAVGHRGLISTILKHRLGLDPAVEGQVLIILDKLDKIGPDAVCKQLVDLALPEAPVRTLVEQLRLCSQDEVRALDLLTESFSAEELSEVVAYQETLALIRAQLPAHANVVGDLSTVRGLGYYTGLVFETTVDAARDFGSICSGGRYDHLTARFMRTELSGVGASVGLDRLTALLFELNGDTAAPKTPSVMVAFASPDAQLYGMQIAQQLRRAGIVCDVALKEQKLANQLKHADRVGATLVVLVGSEEREALQFTAKVLSTGMQTRNIPLADLIAYCRSALL